MIVRFVPIKNAANQPMPHIADLPMGAKYRDKGTHTEMIASATKDALVRILTWRFAPLSSPTAQM